jgi:alkanesulfonate monooxygenase SsuD/methylene tetrahydromethanopterin reductase-like flavin-dependent oxidoreductase (luciferase family)
MELLDDLPWDDYYGPGSVLARVVERRGKVLRLGADLDTVTLLHYAEYLAPVADKRRVRRTHRIRVGHDVVERVVECLDDSNGIVDHPGEDYFAQLLRAYLATGRASTGTFGHATAEPHAPPGERRRARREHRSCCEVSTTAAGGRTPSRSRLAPRIGLTRAGRGTEVPTGTEYKDVSDGRAQMNSVELGYFLSSEEHSPRELLHQAQLASDVGVRSVWISDHYHPWLHEQGESAFVWSVIGAIAATTPLRVTTAVTCPTYRGRHYTVENARIYSLPERPPPVHVSGFGPKATELASRIGDGYVNVNPSKELVDLYRSRGGKGPASAGIKVCWGPDAGECAALAHRLWRTSGVPGELSQELRTPALFDQAATLVTVDKVRESIPCGPAVEPIVESIRSYVEAGFDRVYVNQIGSNHTDFFRFLERELVPAVGELGVHLGGEGATSDNGG